MPPFRGASANHATFAWVRIRQRTAHNAVIVEAVGDGFFHHYYQIGWHRRLAKGLHDKHYLRKHGRARTTGSQRQEMIHDTMFAEKQLVHLSTVDVVIIAFYSSWFWRSASTCAGELIGRRLFHGRPRDDGVGGRPQLSFR